MGLVAVTAQPQDRVDFTKSDLKLQFEVRSRDIVLAFNHAYFAAHWLGSVLCMHA